MSERRYPSIDALRGIALVAMIVYHAIWDLDYFGHVDWPLYTDSGWLAFRDAILVAFLGLSGLSLVLAMRSGVDWTRFVRRRAWIAAGAAAITAFSLWAFPENPIWFGVLHFVAVASFIALPVRHWPWYGLTALAVAIASATPLLRHAVFNDPWLHWIGLVTEMPQSGDYVPLFPWLAAVFAGMAVGQLFVRASTEAPNAGRVRNWRPRGPGGRLLVWSGRESLVIYLLHQPVLVGMFLLAGLAGVSGAPSASIDAFVTECRASCSREGTPADVCVRFCDCAADVVERDFGWARLGGDSLTADELSHIQGQAEACLREDG